MDVSLIERKLSRRPHSPLFARLADEYLRSGMVEAARELLVSGLEKYPSYPAAHLVLARCYAASGEYAAALKHLKISAESLPEVGHLLNLAEEWESSMQPAEAPAGAPEPIELPVPSVSAQTEADAQAETPALTIAPQELPMPAPAPAIPLFAPVRPPEKRRSGGRIEDGRIVSKTLAEIYAMQGEYGEAIITYTMLKQHRPHLTAECDLRISELEQALQAKLNQQKLALSK